MAKRLKGEDEASESAAVWLPVSDLKPWAKNPRENKKAVAKVAASIKRFGFAAPIIARKADLEIIGGHTRWLAAKRLKLERVPVRLLDLDPADAHLLALADNRLGEEADWDGDKLAEILRELHAEDADVMSTGFTEGELEKFLGEAGDPDLGPEAVEPTSQFLVLVTCADEAQQAQILEKLMAEGLDVRAMMS